MEQENILIQIDESWYYRHNGDDSPENEVYFGESNDMEDVVHDVVKEYGNIDFTVLQMYRSTCVKDGKLPWENK